MLSAVRKNDSATEGERNRFPTIEFLDGCTYGPPPRGTAPRGLQGGALKGTPLLFIAAHGFMESKLSRSQCIRIRNIMQAMSATTRALEAVLVAFLALSLLVQGPTLASVSVHFPEAAATPSLGLTGNEAKCHSDGAVPSTEPCPHALLCHPSCTMQALPCVFAPVLTPAPARYGVSETPRYVAFIPERPTRPPLA